MAPSIQPPRVARSLTELVAPVIADDTHWDDVSVTGDVGDEGPVSAPCVQISGSRFTDVRFTGAVLSEARLRDCVFERCELSGAMLDEAAIDRCEFVDCQLAGVVLAGSRLRHVRFDRCRMGGASLRLAAASPVWFADCDLTDADLYRAQMAGVGLVDCLLDGADVSQADLSGGVLFGSDLSGLVGGASIRDVSIDATQVLPLAVQVFAALGVTIVDRSTDHP